MTSTITTTPTVRPVDRRRGPDGRARRPHHHGRRRHRQRRARRTSATGWGCTPALARGPATPTELADRTGTAAVYVTPWLANQAAGGYVEYDAGDRAVLDDARAGPGVRRRGRPGVLPRRLPARAVGAARRPRLRGALPHAAPGSAGTSTTPGCSRGPRGSSGPATWPTWSDSWLPALDGVVAGAAGRRGRRRLGLRSRGLDDPDGAGVRALAVHRQRLPRGLDRGGPPQGRAGRGQRPGAVRGGRRQLHARPATST